MTKNCTIGGADIILRDDLITTQADGSVLVKHGNTSVLCTVCVGDWDFDSSYLPLQVMYQERAYAAGKIPGGFLKRENKSDKEALISRMIDRALRPSIDQSYRFKVQVICTVLEHDSNYYTDILSIIGSSVALQIAGVPCVPMSAYKMSWNGSEWSFGKSKKSKHNVTLAMSAQGLTMFDCYGESIKRSILSEGIHSAIGQLNSVFEMTNSFVQSRRKEMKVAPVTETQNISLNTEMIIEKLKQNKSTSVEKENFLSKWNNKFEGEIKWNQIMRAIARNQLIWSGIRFDGRSFSDLRKMSFSSGILSSTNGSALYSKEKTQVLASVTFGNPEDAQTVETLGGTYKDKFIFHYAFDPYACGDLKKICVSRRDIGHGNLAKRSIKPLLNGRLDKVCRIVSDVMSSDGSSSMGSVCAAYLAMRNANMSIEPVAGISVGLILDGYRHYLMMDINAKEDAWGDMDLKIAGTKNGITSIQMDIKVPWISINVFEDAMNFGMQGVKQIINMYPAQKSQDDHESESSRSDKSQDKNERSKNKSENSKSDSFRNERSQNKSDRDKKSEKHDKKSKDVESEFKQARKDKSDVDSDSRSNKSNKSQNIEPEKSDSIETRSEFETFVKISVEKSIIPVLIGRKGVTINEISDTAGVSIDIDKQVNTVKVNGDMQNINHALAQIFALLKGEEKVDFAEVIKVAKDKLKVRTYEGKDKSATWTNDVDIQVGDLIKLSVGKFNRLSYLTTVSISD